MEQDNSRHLTADMADTVTILNLAIRDLEAVILPAIEEPSGRLSGDIIVKLLTMLRDRQTTPALAAEEERQARLLAETLNLGAGIAQPSTFVADAARAVRTGHGKAVPWERLIDWAEARERRMQGGALRPLMESFAEAGAGGGRDRNGGVADPEKLTLETLRAVSGDIPALAEAEIVTLREIGSGSQKTVFAMGLRDRSGLEDEVILRQDKNYSAFDLSVVDEVAFLRAIDGVPIPKPSPVWLYDGGAVHPFYATARFAGQSDFAVWTRDRGLFTRISGELAEMMAVLHGAIVPDVDPSAGILPGTSGDTPLRRVAHLRAYWERIGDEPSPLADACFGWLEDNAPSSFTMLTPVHGDLALHNVMVDRGHVTAILDWEFAHVGDPQEDISYIKPFIEATMDWQAFLDIYEGAGGPPCDPAHVHWWGVMGMMRLAAGCQRSQTCLKQGRRDLDIRVANQGFAYSGQLLLDTARMIRAG